MTKKTFAALISKEIGGNISERERVELRQSLAEDRTMKEIYDEIHTFMREKELQTDLDIEARLEEVWDKIAGMQAQTRQISISATNTPIKDVFAEVQQQSGYRILYNDEVVSDDLHVTVDVKDAAVEKVLNTLLQNTGLVFVMQNYTFRKKIGLMGVIPFRIGKRISSRFVANGILYHEKDDDFFDIPFDRKTIVGIFQMNNGILLTSKPDLKMNVSGYVSTPGAIQGIYDLGASGNLSTALTWTFRQDRARLILRADDIFNTRIPSASVDYKGQKSSLKSFQDMRTVSLSFVYRFGGYKETERKEVDTSRFGGL